MRAVLLAAGVGRRLGDHGQRPKALLEFGGASLLRRHLGILRSAGVAELVIAVGYQAEMIEREIVACGAGGFARTIMNPDYREGSIVSFWAVREAMTAGGDVLLMDADVLYDHRMIDRLMDTVHANCFLMDRDIEPGEEPVKICVRGGGIVDFEKKVGTDHDYHGESVGFFRFADDVARRLVAVAEEDIASGRRERMYEHAIRDVLLASPEGTFGFEDVTGLPWIEIDYAEDVRRARDEVLPRLVEVRR